MKVRNLSENSDDFTGNVWLAEGDYNSLIDAGTGECWQEISELDSVEKVILTHSHYDHVDNLPKIDDRYNPEIFAFEPDNLPLPAEQLSEGEEINVSGFTFRVIHTPGHKDDSICLYSEEEKILFSGDLIFPGGSFGRTDLAEGDRDQLIKSIEKISELEVEEMYCGHDSATTENVKEQIKESLSAAKKKEPKY